MVSMTIACVQIISSSTLGRNLDCINLYFILSLAWASLLPSFQINQQTSSWYILLMFSFSYFKNISLSISYCYTVNSLEESHTFSKFPGGVSKALKSLMSLIHFFSLIFIPALTWFEPCIERNQGLPLALEEIATGIRATA